MLVPPSTTETVPPTVLFANIEFVVTFMPVLPVGPVLLMGLVLPVGLVSL